MGGIFGIRYFDNRPIVDSDIDTLKSEMARWGPDGSTVWTSNGIALGHLLLYNTPEALFEDQPLQAGPLTMVAEARIDNREELSRQLEIASSELKEAPDSLLIFRAFEKWGENCVDYLLGDWSFALWNADSKELFVARDHHGITGIHYYCDNSRIVFASSLPALLQLEWVPQKPNLDYVAQVLVAWQKFGHATAFENIYRLPPAHYLEVAQSLIRTHRYWFLEHTPDLRLKDDQEYVDTFLEIYREAVRCRLRSHRPVAATLSGGLDSGSLSVLAAEDFRKSGMRFPVYSSVPVYDINEKEMSNRFGDETPYIRATSEFAGNIDVKYIRAKQISPLMAIEKALHILGEPSHSAANMYWIYELLRTAQSDGIGSLLVGQGGNATVSWSGVRKKNLLKYKHPWGMTKAGLRALLPRRLVLFYRIYLRRTRAWEEYSAIKPEFAKEIALSQKMFRAMHDPTFSSSGDSRLRRYKLIQPGESAVGVMLAQFGAEYELEFRDPTFDKRVLEFCIAIPNTQYRRDEYDRMLIRRAMEGFLPDKVLWNKNKGLQAADIVQRVQEVNQELATTLARLSQSNLPTKILDLQRLQTLLEGIQDTPLAKKYATVSSILLRGIMTGIFLMSHGEQDNFR